MEALDAAPWRRAALRLEEGSQALGRPLDAEVRLRLMTYLEIMGRWNRVFNLTAIRDPEEMVTRHVLDSLAVFPYLPAGTVLDVGSGAGLPGIPLALVEPERGVTLLDRSHKRVDFLTEVAAQLGLPNVELVCQRVEDHKPSAPYDVVIARAFASLYDIVMATDHLLAPQGVVVAMKGAFPSEELATIVPPYRVEAVHALFVPGLSAKRHLVVLARHA